MDTRLRQLRVVLQELEQDDVEVVAKRPKSKHVDTRKKKRKFGQKGRLNVRSIRYKKKLIPKNPAREFISITVLNNSKKIRPASNYEYYATVLILDRTKLRILLFS